MAAFKTENERTIRVRRAADTIEINIRTSPKYEVCVAQNWLTARES